MNNNTRFKKPLRRLLYGASAVLILFYLIVLYLGLKPDVGVEYEMYYISHEITEWPGYDNLRFDYGQVEFLTENTYRNSDGEYVSHPVARRRGEGWHTSGRYDGTWSNDEESVLYYIFNEDTNKVTISITVKDYLTEYGYVRASSETTMQEALLLSKQRKTADSIVSGNVETAIIAATDEGNSHRSWVLKVINMAKEAKENGEELTLLSVASAFPSESSRRASYTGCEYVQPSTDGTCEVDIYLGDTYIGTFNQPGEFEFSVDADIVKDELYELKFVSDEDTSFLLWKVNINNQ